MSQTSRPIVEQPPGFTPGPWRFNDTDDGAFEVSSAATGDVKYGDGVAAVWYLGDDRSEAAANAALIAAAPDLLKVVKATLNLFEHVSPDLPTLPELRALIDRAEGRAS